MKAKQDLSISCGGAEPVRYAKDQDIKPEHQEMARRLQPAEPELQAEGELELQAEGELELQAEGELEPQAELEPGPWPEPPAQTAAKGGKK